MSETPLLGLPILDAAQAQKHVTHNEALLLLDAAVHLSVVSRAIAVPPPTPAEAERYLVAAAPTGAWAGQAGKLAIAQAGAWVFVTPRTGWRAWIVDEEQFLIYDGALWRGMPPPDELANLDLVGVNTTADAGNRLAVSSPAVLFSHAGDDHRLKINKQAGPNTASLLYQTNFSGRAEMGLAGDDDFRLKVSADGATWNDAVVIDRATGAVAFPNTAPGAYHAVATLADDVATGANVTPVSLTGLSFAFAANAIYFFRWIGATSAAATTTGCGFQLDVDVAVTDIRMNFYHQLANTGTLTGGSSQADDVSLSVSSGIPVANAEVPVTGRGMLRTGASAGTAQLRLRSEVAAAVTAKAGMTLVVERVA